MAEPGFARIVSRGKAEDQATEVLALALELDRELIRSFIAEATGAVPEHRTVDSIHVRTQCRVDQSGMRRVDLAIECEDLAVWVEAKVDSDEGYNQLEGYARALAACGSWRHRHLVYLTRPGVSEPRIRSLNEELGELTKRVAVHAYDWRQVGELAEGLERSRGHQSRRSSVPHHLAKFLRHWGLYVGALQPEDVQTLESIPAAWATLIQLEGLVRAGVAARGSGPGQRWAPRPGRSGRVHGHWVDKDSGEFGAWAGYTADLLGAEPDPAWLHWDLGLRELADETRGLSLAAGVAISGAPWEQWDVSHLRDELGYREEPWDNELYVLDVCAMKDFGDSDPNRQAERIATWIERRFVQILDRPPRRSSTDA